MGRITIRTSTATFLLGVLRALVTQRPNQAK